MNLNEAELEQQVRVSKKLGIGFVLSIVPLAGLGSIIAMILGLKARRIIQHSGIAIAGTWMAWWCIVVGALGALILPPLTIIELVSRWPD